MAKQKPGPNSKPKPNSRPKPKADEPPRTVLDTTPAITEPPDFYDGDGKKGLHKKYHGKKHKTTIVGTNLKAGDYVVDVGTVGKSLTIWYEALSLKGGKYVCTDLDVIRQQTDNFKIVDGTENVSTTVTNPMNGTSVPITSPKVPIIP